MSAPSHIQQRKISQQAPIDDPKQKQINALCFDHLLMELVPLSKRIEPLLAINNQMEKMELNDEKSQAIGYDLGTKLAEYLLYIKNQGNLNILETLDIMKFVCRDVWRLLYLKQMDNLRTNHRGTFIFIDNSFRSIRNMDSPEGLAKTLEMAQLYLHFPCGVLRGVLHSMGIKASVSAEIIQFPTVQFSVETEQL